MSFPNENKTASGKDGEDMAYANIILSSSYTPSPYSYDFSFDGTTHYYAKKTFWSTSSDTVYPFLDSWYNYPAPLNTIFPNNNKFLNGKDGEDISDSNSKKRSTYELSPYSHVFSESAWKIQEGITTPYLISYDDNLPVSPYKVGQREWLELFFLILNK